MPEVWRYNGTEVQIRCLVEGSYVRSERSLILEPFTSNVLTDFVTEHLKLTSVEWMAKIREWARQQATGES